MVKLLSMIGFLVLVGCIEPPPQNAANNVTTNNSNNEMPIGVGSPCLNDGDCELGYCIQPGESGIPGGYCTKACTRNGSECPNGSHCGLMNEEGNSICLQSCDAESDCVRKNFGCFDFDFDSNRARECFPSGTGEQDVAQSCEFTTDCTGGPGALCLTEMGGFPEGYCSKVCVRPQDCGEDGTCIGGVCAASECEGRDNYKTYNYTDNDQEITFCWIEGTAAVGASCEDFFECEGEDPFCVTELPDGYCSRACSDNAECGEKARCTGVFQRTDPICAATCSGDTDCRDGYRCSLRAPTVDGTEARFCLPGLRE